MGLWVALACFWTGGLVCASCSDDDAGGNGNQGGEPVSLQSSDFTYKLKESPPGLTLWTTPCTHKVRADERAPDAEKSGLRLSAARNEFEPVQLLVGPGRGKLSAKMDEFPDLGSQQRIQVAQVEYEGNWPETLDPLPLDQDLSLSSDRPAGLWITVYVPKDAPAGDHETVLHLAYGNQDIEVPVRLHVFDFSLPDEIHFATQLNVSISDLIPQGGSEEDVKTMLFQHRMTPKSVTWPSGFGWNITWDSEANPNRCSEFWDEPEEPDQYSIGHLAPKYILGQGWNDVGFPNAMIFQFVDNSTPRPTRFCGRDRGDQYGSDAYNQAWSAFLSATETYLRDHGMLDKAYYYVQNEPQNAEDERLAAFLCDLTKTAAPGLRIAISEEPKPEIAEDPDHPCGYDIWIAHLRAYQQDYAWQRQRDHGEQVWFYSLDQDPDPYFNPTRTDNQGMHERIIPWVAWHERITGWAYYDAGRFFHGSRPGIRAELLREGFEDYEYLWLANGKSRPAVFETVAVDQTVDSVASGLTSWNRDPDALMALRYELGRYIEGSRDSPPIIESDNDIHPRDSYFLNFQDPQGQPTADPLLVEGKTYMKIGWSAYDADLGYGWYGEHIDDPGIAKYGYDDVAGYSEVEKSYLYDDYGRDNLFEFALANGKYRVTIGLGRPARGYPNDPHNAAIEGIQVAKDHVTTDEAPIFAPSLEVDLHDGSLSIVVGGRSESTGDWAYTFLEYLIIEPIE